MMRLDTEQEIARRFIGEMIENTRINDLRPGGRTVQIGRALAREAFRLQGGIWEFRDANYLAGCSDDDLVSFAEDVLPDGMTRDEGTRASGGQWVFTRPDDPGNMPAESIPEGIIVSRSSDGFAYSAGAASFALNSPTSTATTLTARAVGTIGNCEADEVDTVQTAVGTVRGGTNQVAITNGTDETPIEEFVDAIRRHVAGIATANTSALIEAVLAVDSDAYGKVRFAKIGINQDLTRGMPKLYIDDGTGSCGILTTVAAGEVILEEAVGGEQIFQLDSFPVATAPVLQITDSGGGSSNPAYRLIKASGIIILGSALNSGDKLETTTDYMARAGLAALAQQVIDGDMFNAMENPGYKSAGEIAEVIPATLYGGAYLTIAISVIMETDATADSVADDIVRVVLAYVNSRSIGDPVIWRKILAKIMEVEGVQDVPYLKINGLEQNIYPAEGEVARTTADSITVS